MIPALARLQVGLSRSFAGALDNPEAWSDPASMARARARVRHDHGGAAIVADSRSILAAIADFRKSGRVAGFRDLKYICLGIGAVDDHGWCVLGDQDLRSKIRESVMGQPTIHRRMRCFQALLSAYWTFPIDGKGPSLESRAGWRSLRRWLAAEREVIAATPDFKPPWFDALSRHLELLTPQPCDQFGTDLLNGDVSSLNDAKDGLAIPQDSWVIDEAVFSHMKAASNLADAPFKSRLDTLLAIANGHGGIVIGETLRVRCVAHLTSRYARCRERPEQAALRDSATAAIGNPWLRRVNWDAFVRVGDKPDDEARDMVFGWLKSRLITDFFELLSADKVNDSRRLAYWLRFAPFVDDMWFALGSSALTRRGGKFAEFRERAKGRLLGLEGSSADNNAFVMRIGSYLAVEFGASGNAFYLFSWDSLGAPLHKALTSVSARPRIGISELKSDLHKGTIDHRDSKVALKSWEQKFDDRLVRLIGETPKVRPACVPELEVLVADGRVEVRDSRGDGGALWVLETERASHLGKKLHGMGFGFRQGRGWFKE